MNIFKKLFSSKKKKSKAITEKSFYEVVEEKKKENPQEAKSLGHELIPYKEQETKMSRFLDGPSGVKGYTRLQYMLRTATVTCSPELRQEISQAMEEYNRENNGYGKSVYNPDDSARKDAIDRMKEFNEDKDPSKFSKPDENITIISKSKKGKGKIIKID